MQKNLRACIFSLDNEYILPFRVFFHSLERTKSIPAECPIYIIHSNSLEDQSKTIVADCLSNYGRSATFVDASKYLPSNLPMFDGDHVSIATFFRLFVGSILPHSIKEAVYLDLDMLALESIRELFEIELTQPLAAVDHCSISNQYRLHGSESGSYFQAGVLVISVEQWRSQGIEGAFINAMNEHALRIRWHDQDVLNIVFKENWQRLPIWLNVCDTITRFMPLTMVSEKAMLIHYNGPHKPWNSSGFHPFEAAWDEAYESMSGSAFDRSLFVKPLWHRVARAVRSRLSGLLYGRY